MTRGRPRTFDGDQALDAAMRVFWSKGFSATSIEDISEATGLQRPSLYAAFGNKAALFRAALARFLSIYTAPESAALADPGSASGAAVDDALAKLKDRLTREHDPHGCFVAQAVADATSLEPEVQVDLKAILDGIEKSVQSRTGDRAAARLAVATIVGLGALARVNRDPVFIEEALSALGAALKPARKTKR